MEPLDWHGSATLPLILCPSHPVCQLFLSYIFILSWQQHVRHVPEFGELS